MHHRQQAASGRRPRPTSFDSAFPVNAGMFRARPQSTVSDSGRALLDCAWPARPPDPSLLLASPAPTPHFYRQGQPGPQLLTFIDRVRASSAPNPSLLVANPSLLLANPSLLLARPSLLLARPLTSMSQTPCFYQPSQATPCRTMSARVGTVPDHAVPILAVSPCRLDTGKSLPSANRKQL